MFRTVALAGCLALVLGPLSPDSGEPQARRVSLEAADCSRHNMMFGDYEVARAEQFATIPVNGTLDIRPESNGGVQIERGTGSTFGITACIGAGARTSAEAQAAADDCPERRSHAVRMWERGKGWTDFQVGPT